VRLLSTSKCGGVGDTRPLLRDDGAQCNFAETEQSGNASGPKIKDGTLERLRCETIQKEVSVLSEEKRRM